MDSVDLNRVIYGLDYGYHKLFLDISSDGHLLVRVRDRWVDLYRVVSEKGVSLAYIRIPWLIEYFMDLVADSFREAAEKQGFNGRVYYAYPLKANSEKLVLKTIYEHGRSMGWGFNTGSLEELMAIREFIDEPRILVIDGVKDREVLRIAEKFRSKGWMVYVDVEDERDLELLKDTGLSLGLRVKLLGSSSGKWGSAAGIGSKFGLNITVLERLAEKYPWVRERVKLLHVHGGSQLTDPGVTRRLLVEAANIYRQLSSLGFRIERIDHGGGVPYPYVWRGHGNPGYSIREYADMVVSSVKELCSKDFCPGIVFEGGRFIVAAHRIVVSKVISARPYTAYCTDRKGFPVLDEMRGARSIGELRGIARKLVELRTRLYLNVHNYGLDQRRMLEELEACSRELIAGKARELLNNNPGELGDLVKYMNYLLEYLVSPSRRFLVDMSVFRDLPDKLIVGDYFQPVPLQDLDKPPEILAVLSDKTCDTMGEISEFITPSRVAGPVFTSKDNRLIAVPGKELVLNGVPLHDPGGKEYYIAFLDTGAYQDMLSMKHNLLGEPDDIILD